jgi:hypothetical protein
MSKKLRTTTGLARTAQRGARRLTAPSRALPDFLIIGSQKAGTTSLADYLVEHPDVFWPGRTELHYFDWSYKRSLSWYQAWFERRSVVEAHERATGRPARVGEKTPDYLVVPQAPTRVKAALPDVRIVVALRDPVARAHSHWSMSVRQGVEPLSFLDALDAEESRIASVDLSGPLRGTHYLKHGYQMRSRYVEHLERWFSVFDRSQVFAYRSEDLYADPDTWLPRILAHLGVDTEVRSDAELPHANAGDHEELDPALRERLIEGFADYDARLQDLIGLSYYQGVP